MPEKKFRIGGILVIATMPLATLRADIQNVPIIDDTFLDSSEVPTVVNGIDVTSYGGDAKVKAVSSATQNANSGTDVISYTHALFQIPAAIFTAYARGQVSAVTINYYPVNDSLSNPTSQFYDGDGVLQLYPLTRAFTVGNGTQSPLVASTAGGATWNTFDGKVTDTWTTPGGDYDLSSDVIDNNTTLPVSRGSVPFTWDITPLLANPTTRAELQSYGALIRLPNEPVSQFQIDNSTQDFASLDSAEATGSTPYIGITSTAANLTWNNTGGAGDGTSWDVTQQNWNRSSAVSTFNSSNFDNVTFNDANNGHYLVTIASTVTPGSVTVSNSAGNYTFSGAGGIARTSGLTKTGTGSLTLSTSNTYSGATVINAGTLNLAGVNALPPATDLTIGTPKVSATVVVQNIGAAHAVQVNSLTLAGATNSWDGKLDLVNNDLDVKNGSLAIVTNQIAAGHNNAGGGNWQGSAGITSSTAAADTSHLTALGVLVNDNGSGRTLYGANGTIATTFGGITPGDGDILIKYTYYGDANLDGHIDGSDYTLIDNGFLTQLTGWANGDFNYDGIVDGSDYTLIDNAFNTQGAAIASNIASDVTSSTAQIGTAAVPEPASLGLAMIGVALLRRRSQSKLK